MAYRKTHNYLHLLRQSTTKRALKQKLIYDSNRENQILNSSKLHLLMIVYSKISTKRIKLQYYRKKKNSRFFNNIKKIYRFYSIIRFRYSKVSPI